MLKKILLFIGIIFSSLAFAGIDFLVVKDNKIIKQQGDINKRYSPCSTFKIVISLMGYDDGILIDHSIPEYPFKSGYVDWLDLWKQPHTPSLWMKNSCVWYSQVITQQLGMKKFGNYIKIFNYGNQDVSGDKQTNNGLTHAWLDTSLAISVAEQVECLKKLINNDLLVSKHAHEITKDILFKENLSNGWRLYGKTGGGYNHGWFVGWIEKSGEYLVFATHMDYVHKQDTTVGRKALQFTKEKLLVDLVDSSVS
jgi:beta-lactamase class D